MLKKIKEVPIIKNGTPFEIQLNSDLESKVEKNWEEFLEKREGYWDGELLSVTHFDVATNILEISKARYSWLIYSKNHNDLDIRSLIDEIWISPFWLWGKDCVENLLARLGLKEIKVQSSNIKER